MANDLQQINQVIPEAILDIRYASENNVTKKKLYDRPVGALRTDALAALKKVADSLGGRDYRLVVWDAYRPPGIQEVLLKVCDDERYVAHVSNHSRGITVDATLADGNGIYLDMGTDHDEFDERAHANSNLITNEQAKNREILQLAMEQAGFQQLPTEWWHFDYIAGFTQDVLNVELAEL